MLVVPVTVQDGVYHTELRNNQSQSVKLLYDCYSPLPYRCKPDKHPQLLRGR